MVSVRAVYHNGQLHLLDPVDLNDGEEILLQIVPKRPSVRELIGDMLTTVEQKDADTDVDEAAILSELAEALKGQRPLSEIIIEERQSGR